MTNLLPCTAARKPTPWTSRSLLWPLLTPDAHILDQSLGGAMIGTGLLGIADTVDHDLIIFILQNHIRGDGHGQFALGTFHIDMRSCQKKF